MSRSFIGLANKSNAAKIFHQMSVNLTKPYLTKTNALASSKLPPKPSDWEFKSGWYRYEEGKKPEKVSHPLEDSISFDIELLYKISSFPTLATCSSPKAWYGWVSPYLTGETSTPSDLIPLNPENEDKIIIGHNVNFDRSKVLDDYISYKNSNSFYIDTISLFHSRYGTPTIRKPSVFVKAAESLFKGNEAPKLLDIYTPADYQLHTLYQKQFGEVMNKDVRSFFDSTSKDLIVNEFQNCMNYCADDVIKTHRLFAEFWKTFYADLNHPMEFFALKEMGNNKVTLNKSNWDEFDNNCNGEIEQATKRYKDELKKLVFKHTGKTTYANQFGTELMGTKWQNDLHLFYDKDRKEIMAKPRARIGKEKLSSVFNKSQVPLWLNGSLTVEPEFQHIIDDFISTTFWNFSNKFSSYNYVPTHDKDIVTLLPAIKICATSSGQPLEPLWISSPDSKLIGHNYRSQIVPPKGYKYVAIDILDGKSTILDSYNSNLVSPFMLRNAINKLEILQARHITTASSVFFKQLGIEHFQLASTFSNEVRYLVKEEDESKALKVLENAKKLLLLAMSAELQTLSKLGIDDYEVQPFEIDPIEVENQDPTLLFKQFLDLYTTQEETIASMGPKPRIFYR